MQIREDDLSGPAIIAFLDGHLDDMRRITPPGSIHALDLNGLRAPDVTFWTLWDRDQLMGCGALKELSPADGEIKSMRTAVPHRRQGVASAMLAHILAEAARRKYTRINLETGAMPEFEPARSFYERHGFVPCRPFADYVDDPNSVFMTKAL